MNPVAKVLLVLAASLFFVPPIVAAVVVDSSDNDPSMGVDDIEGMAAGMIVAACWLVAFLLLLVGVIFDAFGSKREGGGEEYSPIYEHEAKRACKEHHVMECAACWPDEEHAPASELGHRLGPRWICDEHNVIGCPTCAARVSVWDIPTDEGSSEGLSSTHR